MLVPLLNHHFYDFFQIFHWLQAMGVCPTISIDKTDGCGVWLSNQCLDCQVVTAKSSEMNISIPKGDDGDYVSTYRILLSKFRR